MTKAIKNSSAETKIAIRRPAEPTKRLYCGWEWKISLQKNFKI